MIDSIDFTCDTAQERFDPYHLWLGIPPQGQPPNHYCLLGIEPFETSPAVIENAADQRMAYLRLHQIGSRGSNSQQLLNEVAAARVCLLRPELKATYDERLRQQSANCSMELWQTPATLDGQGNGIVPDSVSLATDRRRRAAQERQQIRQAVAISLLAVSIAGAIIFIFFV